MIKFFFLLLMSVAFNSLSESLLLTNVPLVTLGQSLQWKIKSERGVWTANWIIHVWTRGDAVERVDYKIACGIFSLSLFFTMLWFVGFWFFFFFYISADFLLSNEYKYTHIDETEEKLRNFFCLISSFSSSSCVAASAKCLKIRFVLEILYTICFLFSLWSSLPRKVYGEIRKGRKEIKQN